MTKDAGRFVFTISHPCFDVDTRSAWSLESEERPSGPPTIFRKISGYRNLHGDHYVWDLAEGRSAVTAGYHRPLAWYLHPLRNAGWVVLDMAEPLPAGGFGSSRVPRAWVEQIPLHLGMATRREPRERRSNTGRPMAGSVRRRTPGLAGTPGVETSFLTSLVK